tara:strand:+ start:468 stop:695 length:228 start_codon:yes stop_codon:yes gene_type:complete
MTKRRKIVLDNTSRMMKAISLKSDRYVFEAIINEIIEEAINYTRCCTELKCGECDCEIKYPNIGCDTIKDCKKTH